MGLFFGSAQGSGVGYDGQCRASTRTATVAGLGRLLIFGYLEPWGCVGIQDGPS